MQTSEMFEVAAAVPQRLLVCGLPFFSAPADLEVFGKLGLCSVYAVGPESETPTRVSWSSRPDQQIGKVQQANWKALTVREIVWTPGPVVARALEKEIHRLLTAGGRHIRGEWFDVPTGLLLAAFDVATRNLKAETLTHSGMIERFEMEKRRRLAAGLKKLGGPLSH